ncbi:CAAX protease self-immunity [Lishizhenia tianjinensis]|uniref:CAAX protease self-immunity n=2 Tax=Lishizhenia tianjinensis TaxID=477690 RepID=A0A1I6ZIP2_9FLAO|nr:CAAX protease self-immunity [Lishizhenia tianjinensis]
MKWMKQIEDRSPFLQVLILICLGLVFSVVLGAIAVSFYSGVVSMNLLEHPYTMAKDQPIAFLLVNQVPFQVGMFLLPALIYRSFERTKSKTRRKDVIWAILLFASVMLLLPFLTDINAGLLKAFGAYENALTIKENSDGVIQNLVMDQSPMVFVMTVLVIGIITGTAEEFFFRGFVYDHLAKNSGNKWLAILVSAAFFGVLHFNYVQILPLLSFGIALALIYEFTNSLVISAALHALNNTVNIYWMYTDSFPEFMDEQNVFISALGLVLLLSLILLKRKALRLK